MKKQTIAIEGSKQNESGEFVICMEEIEAFVEGNYAIHRDYADPKVWRVTYIPVGFYFPTPRMTEIKTKKDAISILNIWREAFGEDVPMKDNKNEWSKKFMPKMIDFPKGLSANIQEKIKLVLTK